MWLARTIPICQICQFTFFLFVTWTAKSIEQKRILNNTSEAGSSVRWCTAACHLRFADNKPPSSMMAFVKVNMLNVIAVVIVVVVFQNSNFFC
jgi:hypothetical protein